MLAKKEKFSVGDIARQQLPTLIILGIVLVLIVVWLITSAVVNSAKYDITMLREQLNFSAMSADESKFFDKLVNVNSDLFITLSDSSNDGKGSVINNLYTEVLQLDSPSKLVSVKAAELDLINTYYRWLEGNADEKKVDNAKKNLSAKIGRAVK